MLARAEREFEFDAFELDAVTQGHPLSTLAFFLLHRRATAAPPAPPRPAPPRPAPPRPARPDLGFRVLGFETTNLYRAQQESSTVRTCRF